MSDSQQKALDSLRIKQIGFKEGGDVYEIRLLNARQGRVAFAKAISLLAPLFSTSMDTIEEYSLSQDVDDDGNPIEGTGSVSFFELSVILSQQIDRPEFQELLDVLLSDITKNGGMEFDFDEEFAGRLDDQMKIIEYAFTENLATPFISWLKDKGYVTMSTSLQSIVAHKGSAIQKEW